MRPRPDWTFPRLAIVLSYGLVWLASGFLFDFDYRVVAFSDPLITAVLAAGLVLVAGLVADDRPWLYVAAGLATAGVPFIALFAFNAFFAIGEPATGGRFLGAVLLLLAMLVAVPAAVSGHAGARGRRPTVPLRSWAQSRQGLYVVGVAALASGMALTGTFVGDAGPAGPRTYDFDAAAAGVPTVSVIARDSSFEGAPELRAGQISEIVVANEGDLVHTFTYRNEGVEYDHELAPGATVHVLVRFGEAGVVKFRCLPHSGSYDDDPAASMVGRIVVAAP